MRCVEFGLDRERKLYYCALEFIEGEDLAKILARQGTFPERRALEIARDIARALDHASSRDLVHRDVKPQNIMIMPDGTPKLLDLGLARSAGDQDTRLTQAGTFVGSPHYASPEQARGAREQDVRTDIYSLGATLYHMVTGQTPFPGDTAAAVLAKVVSEELPWPAEVNPQLSDGCCTIIEKALASSPEDRYATPAALIADIDTHLGGGPVAPLAGGRSVVARPGRGGPRARRGSARHAPVARRPSGVGAGAYVAVVAGLAILAAGGAFFLLGGPAEEPAPGPRRAARPEPPPTEPEKEPEADRDREFQEMFDFAEAYAKEHPGDFALVISNFEKVCVRARGTRFELEADQRVRDAKKRWREAALAALEERKARAAEVARAGDFDGALAALQGLPAGLAQQITHERRAETARLKAEAARRIDGALAEAEAQLGEGDTAGARKALDGLASVRFADAAATVAARADAIRARADTLDEEQKTAAARKATVELPVILDQFDDLVGAGEYAKAHELAARAAGREDLSGVAATLEGAAGVAAALVERRNAVRAAVEASVGKNASLRTAKGLRK
ncbi:MAG: protein kinase domain-containing protein, partial [Planctomycetota bacterium]